MKKIRIVVVFFAGFALLYSLFWTIYLKAFNINDKIVDAVNVPISANIFSFIIIFASSLLWFIYELKLREESKTSLIIFLLHLAYAIIFTVDLIRILKSDVSAESKDYSLSIILTSGLWVVASVVPLFIHLVASIEMGGHDNVEEPTNIFGFFYTIIGFCYIVFILILNCLNPLYCELVFVLGENGLLYTLIIISYILVAGLRFNSVILNILNIVLNLTFSIWLIVLVCRYDQNIHKYLCSLNLFITLPMLVLSVFILKRYIQYDRFYKGRTKNFLKD